MKALATAFTIALVMSGLMMSGAEDEEVRDVSSDELREKKVLFHATLTHGTGALRNEQMVKMDTVHRNVGGGYNRYSGYFTVPHDGYYHFYLQFCTRKWKNRGGELFLIHNGKRVINLIAENPGYIHHVQSSGSTVIYCEKNDKLWLNTYKRATTFYIHGNGFTNFGGYRLPFY